MKRNLKKARMLAELQALSVEQLRRLDKKTLSDIVFDLNRNHNVTLKQLSKILGMSLSGASRLANPPKQDNTQETRRVLDHGIDIDVLIKHFRAYIPKSEEEIEQIKELAVVLMDCVKR